MHILHLAKKRKAFTFVEVMITTAILGVIITMVSRTFVQNTRYQQRLTMQSDGDNEIRNILWTLHQDLKVSRSIIYPRLEFINVQTEKKLANMISDTRLVVRNFDGDIVSYAYREKTRELIRCISRIPIDGVKKKNETKVIGKNIDVVIFTNRNEMNNLVGIYLESGPSMMLDSVYLMNE